jgi:hypothetical protein
VRRIKRPEGSCFRADLSEVRSQRESATRSLVWRGGAMRPSVSEEVVA